MEKIQVYLHKEERDALRRAAAQSGRSVAEIGPRRDPQGCAQTSRRGPGCHLGWRAEAHIH